MDLLSSVVAYRSSKANVFSFIVLVLIINGVSGAFDGSNVYTVHLGELQHDDPLLVTRSHHDILESLLGSKEAVRKSIIYSYRHGFSGFAAKLNAAQARNLSEHPEVVHISRSRKMELKTTRVFDYLGLMPSAPKGLLHDANMGSEAIIGVVDSGIWPESRSFNDEGYGPIPKRWKGRCVAGDQFDPKKHCNKKLIGAKYFIKGMIQGGIEPYNATAQGEFMSPRDKAGHGTHCASIAAGSFVQNVSHLGYAAGTVRGGAPRARLASYKVCWENGGCVTADILKGIDQSIRDGVDVISLSIGSGLPVKFEVDQKDTAMATFQAVMKGIPVVYAAGNEGPNSQTVDNVAPWVITVAAANMNRVFLAPITLGNNITIYAEGFFQGPETGFIGLLAADEIKPSDIFEGKLKDKVVLVFDTTTGTGPVLDLIAKEGCKGIIFARTPEERIKPCDRFPCIYIDYELGSDLLLYYQTTKFPVVKIGASKTVVGGPIPSKIARFSCRGPNSISPAILKPDIAAPGVNILGAVPGPGTGQYDLYSGTSMAAPAVAGIVALLKIKHPDWSPAAIKSALITTAWKTDPSGEPIISDSSPRKIADPFDYGGGIVNPEKASDPGLVYDLGLEDYAHYLCSEGFDDKSISRLLHKHNACPNPRPSMLDVNMPSITIPHLNKDVTIKRTVTNVGAVDSVYKAVIEAPLGIKLIVKPETLVFNSNTKKVTYTVNVSTTHKVNTNYLFGSLSWTDGTHNVVIPVSVRTKILMGYN